MTTISITFSGAPGDPTMHAVLELAALRSRRARSVVKPDYDYLKVPDLKALVDADLPPELTVALSLTAQVVASTMLAWGASYDVNRDEGRPVIRWYGGSDQPFAVLDGALLQMRLPGELAAASIHATATGDSDYGVVVNLSHAEAVWPARRLLKLALSGQDPC